MKWRHTLAALAAATLLGTVSHVDVMGTPRQNAASQIDITDVFAFTAVAINPWASSMTYPVECIFFVNKAPVAAKHVRFYFEYTAVDGEKAGQVVGKDSMDVRGTFGTGIAQEEWPRRNAPVHGKQCRDLPGALAGGGKMRYDETRGDVTLSGYVTDVEYEDGTSWHVQPQSQTP